MARQSARRPAPARATSRSPFGGNSTQSRQASTMAAAPAAAPYRGPAPTAATPVAQPQQPGMFAQMATTAAGVAVGSAVGHTLGAGLTSMFSGSSAPAEVQQAAAAQQAPATGARCEADARNFTRCLEDSDGNYQACDFYLQQLKACQQAASPY